MPYKDRDKQLAAQKRYYEQHKEKILTANRNKRGEKYRYTQALKASTPCKDCAIQYPAHIMQFDHVSGEKIGNVSTMYRLYSLEKIKEEIAKCEIVCANCHAHRTWIRK